MQPEPSRKSKSQHLCKIYDKKNILSFSEGLKLEHAATIRGKLKPEASGGHSVNVEKGRLER